MGTEARSWMDMDTLGKATKTEECVRDEVVEKPLLIFELVSQFFCMPIKQAAVELNVGLTVLKKRCRELGIPRWPSRKELGKDDTPEKAEKTKMVVQMLQQRKKLMEERPDAELDEETKVFRQAVDKEKYMVRKRKRNLGIALQA